MLVFAIATFFTLVCVASAIALADCWVRGRYTFEILREERALLEAGFVPMAQPAEQRVRQALRFDALTGQSYPSGRLPVQRVIADRPRSRPDLTVTDVA